MSNGFPIVFRLRPSRTIQAAGARDSWIARLQAEPVFNDRSVFAEGDRRDERGQLFVASAGSMGQAASLLEQLQADPQVGMVYIAPPRFILSVAGAVSSVNWEQQIRLPEARELPQWQVKKTVDVALVDSGVDNKNPQLARVALENHGPSARIGEDLTHHGTHVAGLVAAHPDGNDFAGIAWDCTQVTMHQGLFSPYNVGAYYRALRAAGASARLINISAGGEQPDDTEAELIADAIAAGAIVVAAAGNFAEEHGEGVGFPAAYEGVIAVGSVDRKGARAPTSSFGDELLLTAPGVDIVSCAPTYPIRDLATFASPPLCELSGTSMAAPIVTGVIARMLAHQPGLTREQVIDIIRNNLPGPWNNETGFGVIDAEAILRVL